MNTTNTGPPEDGWLTLAEIADELRVNPATVRLWVSKGQLEATRAGMRKWIVRRSDLDRMLASVNSVPANAPQPTTEESPVPRRRSTDRPVEEDRQPPRFLPPVGTRESATQLMELANDSLVAALRASASALPSAGYPDRLRAIADGFEHLASTMIHSARTAGAVWTGKDVWGFERLPWEVRPTGNRPRREGLWERFDQAFVALGEAMGGTDVIAVALAFRGVSDELLAVADQLADGDAQRADSRAG